MAAIVFITVTYLLPILSIVFCANLVSIIKKVKNNENTYKNTFWLIVSLTIIVWSIGMAAII